MMCSFSYENTASDLLSTLAVASSRTKILLCLSTALARQKSCLWPTLKLVPPSSTCPSRPPTAASTTVFSWTCNVYTSMACTTRISIRSHRCSLHHLCFTVSQVYIYIYILMLNTVRSCLTKFNARTCGCCAKNMSTQ